MGRRTLVIVNPASGNGATGRRWRAVEAALVAALGPCEVEQTRAARDAERIAREGVRAGVERVLVAGGDGTVGEVVTGLLAAELGHYAEIGLLPLGTGGDLPRTLGIPRKLDAAIACVVRGVTRRLDAGRATYRDAAQREATTYFLNEASFGLSARVAQLVNQGSKALGATASFLAGALRGVLQHRSEPVRLRVDGTLVYDAPLVLAAVANGRYFGGGMHIAPGARPDDGCFDVVAVAELSRRRLLSRLPALYRGRHLGDPAVSQWRGVRVEAEAAAGRVPVEVDGEDVGWLPARFELLPGAIRILSPAA